MPTGVFRRQDCRLCGANQLVCVAPFTATPVADAYVTAAELGQPQPVYPLDMYQCLTCGHVQLLDVVDPSILFSRYSYFSGQSAGLVKHFGEYAERVIRQHSLAPGSLVIDVGSNDGAFLQFFQEAGMRVLGLDPARNVAEVANERGIETLPEFLSEEVAERVRAERGPADVVTANNVYAHTDDMAGMTRWIRRLLGPEGVFVFEVSYLLDVIDKMLLGTIFHEHLCYHAVRPLEAFLRREGLELIDVERVTIQGGSLICTAQLVGGKRPVAPSVAELKELEATRGLDRPETLQDFFRRVTRLRDEVHGLLTRVRSEGNRIAGFGAARGGTLLIYHFGMGDLLEFIVDDSPDKQGLFSPGHHIPVLPTAALYERKPEYAYILAWVHTKPIVRNHHAYLTQGGRFITCYPDTMVIDSQSPPL